MNDDSDDDILLSQSTFRPNRRAEKTAARQANLLDDALEDSERQMTTLSQISAYNREQQQEDPIEECDIKAISRSTKTRQQALDAMEGLDDDDLDDDENEDHESHVFDRKRRKILQHAHDTDESDNLGIRALVQFKPERSHGLVQVYESEARVLDALRETLNDKALVKDEKYKIIKPVVDKLRGNLETGVVHMCLEKGRIPLLLTKYRIPSLHYTLVTWLIRTSQSPCSLAAGALRTLLILIETNRIPSRQETTSLEFFLESLTCWIPRRPSTIEKSQASERSNNLGGLLSLLRFWQTCGLPNCGKFSPDTARRCMVALTLLGMDQNTVRSKRSSRRDFIRRDHDRRDRLEPLLQATMRTMLACVAKHLTSDSELEAWMASTAEAILHDVARFGPGPPGSEDADDEKAWLCYAALVRAVPQVDADAEPNAVLCRFKIHLALQATKACLTEFGTATLDEMLIKRLEGSNNTQTTVLTQQELSALLKLAQADRGWYAILASYVAFLQLEYKSELEKTDAPRILAAIECAFMASSAGYDFVRADAVKSDDCLEFGSKERALTFLQVLQLIESVADPLVKRVAHLANHPHFRRADYLLKVNKHYLVSIREKAGRAGLEIAGSPVQKTLTSFFKINKEPSPPQSKPVSPP